MSDQKPITPAGRNFCLMLIFVGLAAAVAGAWPFLYPPPNPQTFMDRLNQLMMVGFGTAIAFGALLILVVRGPGQVSS